MRKRKEEQVILDCVPPTKKVKTTTDERKARPSGTIDRFFKFRVQDDNPDDLIPNPITTMDRIPGVTNIPPQLS
eukprot:2990562-Heterocapsa_arctica.AAC.1